MMGGSVSHEFMLLTPIGEDSIAICDECGYSANMEAAPSIIEVNRDEVSNDIEKVATPDQESIEDVCAFLNVPVEKSCKAVVYQKNSDDSYVVIFLRGDLEVNETKVTNFIGDNIHPAVITAESGLCAGYMGPFGLDAKCTVLYDSSLKGANNLVAGGNETGFHYTGLDMERDVKDAEFGDFAKIIDGGICPKCGKKHIHIHRGIEVGNIFQLGTKYTESMNMTYVDEKGESHYPIMGCYGIGVGRLAASICEARHDDYGPIWPITIAPWQVHICALRAHNNPEVKAAADKLYNDLLAKGIEVIYDDRKASNGVMFSDADLLGVPYRVIVSPRNLEENAVEVVTRDKSLQEKVNIDNAADTIAEMVRKAIAEMNNVQ
jgi:prolyl-tRNA synthetase